MEYIDVFKLTLSIIIFIFDIALIMVPVFGVVYIIDENYEEGILKRIGSAIFVIFLGSNIYYFLIKSTPWFFEKIWR